MSSLKEPEFVAISSGTRLPANRTRLRPRQRIYELTHLSPLGSTSHGPDVTQALRKICGSLLRFDVWTLDALACGVCTTPQLVGRGALETFERLLAPSLAELRDDLLENEVDFRNKIEFYTDCLSDQEICDLLKSSRTAQYYGEMMRIRRLLYQAIDYEYRHHSINPGSRMPEARQAHCNSRFEYNQQLLLERGIAERRCRDLILACFKLRADIRTAVMNRHLTDEVLAYLKVKMEPLQETFNDITSLGIVSTSAKDLIEPHGERWWETEHGPEKLLNDFVEGDHEFLQTTSTLAFLVPSVLLISCIPMGLGAANSQQGVGTPQDADFYQLIAAVAVQLLGILTLIWPTVIHRQLLRLPRIWTWTLAAISTCCTIAAIPLYITASRKWCNLLLFAGSATQALIMLQLVYPLSIPGTNKSKLP